MTNFAYVSGDPDNLTGGAAANMVDIQGPLIDLAEWLNTDLQPRVAAAVPTFVTSLPVSATDGQEIYYLADATNGVIWHLRYNAGSASAYKWEFVGGSQLSARSLAAVSAPNLPSGTWGPFTPAVQVVVPLSGEYNAEGDAGVQHSTLASTWQMGFSVAGANPVNAIAATTGAAAFSTVLSFHDKLTLAAAASVALSFTQNQANATVWRTGASLRLTPVRVG